MNKARILVITSGVTLPVVIYLALPFALAQFLVRPGDSIARPFLSKNVGLFIVVGTLISWLLWALILTLALALGWAAFKRFRVLFSLAVLAFTVLLALQIRGSHDAEFEGVWEHGFEHSDFFVAGDCQRPRYWLSGSEEFYSQVRALGNPTAVRVRFKGTTTRMGSYGHLGQYLREIQVAKVITIEASRPCIHR